MKIIAIVLLVVLALYAAGRVYLNAESWSHPPRCLQGSHWGPWSGWQCY